MPEMPNVHSDHSGWRSQNAKPFTAVLGGVVSSLHVTVCKLGFYLEGMVGATFVSQFGNDRPRLARRSSVEQVCKCERRCDVRD